MSQRVLPLTSSGSPCWEFHWALISHWALAVEDARVRAVIELSGGMPGEWEDRVNAGMPPVLILHGVEDAIVPVSEARKLQGLLERHKIPHEIVLMPGETHWFSAASQPKLLMTCASFLARYL
jgi:predicted esterase